MLFEKTLNKLWITIFNIIWSNFKFTIRFLNIETYFVQKKLKILQRWFSNNLWYKNKYLVYHIWCFSDDLESISIWCFSDDLESIKRWNRHWKIFNEKRILMTFNCQVDLHDGYFVKKYFESFETFPNV